MNIIPAPRSLDAAPEARISITGATDVATGEAALGQAVDWFVASVDRFASIELGSGA